MKIGISCHPTQGGSGVVATELGKELAARDHEVHFITSSLPVRLREFDQAAKLLRVTQLLYPAPENKEIRERLEHVAATLESRVGSSDEPE